MFLLVFLEFLNNKGKYCVPCCIQMKKFISKCCTEKSTPLLTQVNMVHILNHK